MEQTNSVLARWLGLAAVLFAGVLLAGPPLVLFAGALDEHQDLYWDAPGQAWLGGLLSLGAAGLVARLGRQLWRGGTAPRWTVVVGVLALLVVVAFGGLVLLRSGGFLPHIRFDVIG